MASAVVEHLWYAIDDDATTIILPTHEWWRCIPYFPPNGRCELWLLLYVLWYLQSTVALLPRAHTRQSAYSSQLRLPP